MTNGSDIAELSLRAIIRFSHSGESVSYFQSAPTQITEIKFSHHGSIKSEDDLDKAISEIDSLLSCGRALSAMEMKRLDGLSDAVIDYENVHHKIPPARPGQILRHLLDARGVTQDQVATATRIPRSDLRSLLRNKVSLSQNQIQKLARYFGVKATVFGAPKQHQENTAVTTGTISVLQYPVKMGAVVIVNSSGPLQVTLSPAGTQLQLASG